MKNIKQLYDSDIAVDLTDFVTAEEFANKHGRVVEQVKSLLREGRIEGAVRVGGNGQWYVPKSAEYPGVSVKEIITEDEIDLEDYYTITEYAEEHNRTTGHIRNFLRGGRIKGAIKVGTHQRWMIPKDAPYPDSRR